MVRRSIAGSKNKGSNPLLLTDIKMSEIKNLKIGDLFSIRKNGIVYEFLGYCPIENLPIAFNRNKYETVYFEDENKKVYIV